MNEAKLLAYFIAIVGVLGSLYGVYKLIDHNGYQRHVNEQQAANLKEAESQAKRTKEAAEQHDNDQTTINNLAGELNKRLHLHIPICPSTTKENPDGTAGIFSSGVDATFGQLQEGTNRLIQRCDQLNIDAIEANKTMR